MQNRMGDRNGKKENGNGNEKLYKKVDGKGLLEILFTNIAMDDSQFMVILFMN